MKAQGQDRDETTSGKWERAGVRRDGSQAEGFLRRHRYYIILILQLFAYIIYYKLKDKMVFFWLKNLHN